MQGLRRTRPCDPATDHGKRVMAMLEDRGPANRRADLTGERRECVVFRRRQYGVMETLVRSASRRRRKAMHSHQFELAQMCRLLTSDRRTAAGAAAAGSMIPRNSNKSRTKAGAGSPENVHASISGASRLQRLRGVTRVPGFGRLSSRPFAVRIRTASR